MPIALLTGRKDVMQLFVKDVFFYSTFGGEALSMAAAIATIHEMIDKNVPTALAAKGKKLKEGYNALAAKHDLTSVTTCQGFDCRTIITFNASAGDPLILKSFVQQEMIKRGILWGGFHNVCFTHTDEDITKTLTAYEEVLPLLASALKENNVAEQLKGKAVEAVFRKVGDVQRTFKEKELLAK
jgi:glutamate-1-semialdehyde aminotransferase